MDFLKRDVRRLFTAKYPYIATKPKDEPPAKYNIGANVVNSLVGSGAILNGYTDNSVLFRKVFTGENSTVKHSLILEGCYIGNNCVVEYAILDKEVVLSDGKHVIGSANAPVVITKGTVL
jgi:glucose-1-phosphate adenylyltransferase